MALKGGSNNEEAVRDVITISSLGEFLNFLRRHFAETVLIAASQDL